MKLLRPSELLCDIFFNDLNLLKKDNKFKDSLTFFIIDLCTVGTKKYN